MPNWQDPGEEYPGQREKDTREEEYPRQYRPQKRHDIFCRCSKCDGPIDVDKDKKGGGK
jgi:hypothetical protein